MKQCSSYMGLSDEVLQSKDFNNAVQFAQNFINFYRSMIPDSFLKQYKNPCWYSNLSENALSILQEFDSTTMNSKRYLAKATKLVFNSSSLKNRLLCLPYFFVPGFPKSATTALDTGLRKHPQIIGPVSKEPHWWTRGLHTKVPSKDIITLSVVRYTLYFTSLTNELTSDTITYDASQSTLWDSPLPKDGQDFCVLPAIISQLLPRAKFVVMMRDPVDRLISHYIWSCKFHNGDDITKWPAKVLENGRNLLEDQTVAMTHWFDKCVERNSFYDCANARTFNLKSNLTGSCGQIGHRLGVGLYHVHIRKWLKFFPKEQFLFLRMEDLIKKPLRTMRKLAQFLDIDSVSKDTKQWFSEKVNQRTQEQDSVFTVKPITKQLLRDFYSPHNELLAELLDDDRFLWNDVFS